MAGWLGPKFVEDEVAYDEGDYDEPEEGLWRIGWWRCPVTFSLSDCLCPHVLVEGGPLVLVGTVVRSQLCGSTV